MTGEKKLHRVQVTNSSCAQVLCCGISKHEIECMHAARITGSIGMFFGASCGLPVVLSAAGDRVVVFWDVPEFLVFERRGR